VIVSEWPASMFRLRTHTKASVFIGIQPAGDLHTSWWK